MTTSLLSYLLFHPFIRLSLITCTHLVTNHIQKWSLGSFEGMTFSRTCTSSRIYSLPMPNSIPLSAVCYNIASLTCIWSFDINLDNVQLGTWMQIHIQTQNSNMHNSYKHMIYACIESKLDLMLTLTTPSACL